MTKAEVKITGMSHPRRVKTAVDALTTLETIQRMKPKPRKVESLSLSFISGILIAFFTIVGCSDMPYSGSMVTTDNVDVDPYIVSPNEELVCLQNGTGSECLTLMPEDPEEVDSTNGPIIHIHPERLVYIFYHEDTEIVRVERAIDTTEIVETLTETTEDHSPQTSARSSGTVGDDANDNNNPDNTQQSDPPPQQQNNDQPNDDTPPPPPPPQQQNDDQTGDTNTASDDSEDNNNPDNTQQPRTPPPPPLPPQTTNVPPGNSNQNDGGDNNPDSTISHQTPNAIYHDHVEQWYVTIYYPENYKGPRTTGDFGFSVSSSNGTIGDKTVSNRGVRFPITIGEGMLYVTVAWDTNPAHWEGDPPPRHYLIQARAAGTHRIMVTME